MFLACLLSNLAGNFIPPPTKKFCWYRHLPHTSHTNSTSKFTFREAFGSKKRKGFSQIYLFTHLFYNDRSWLSEQAYTIEQGMVVMPVLFSKACQKIMILSALYCNKFIWKPSRFPQQLGLVLYMNRRSCFPWSKTWCVVLWFKAHFKFQAVKPAERAFEKNADTPSVLTILSPTIINILIHAFSVYFSC